MSPRKKRSEAAGPAPAWPRRTRRRFLDSAPRNLSASAARPDSTRASNHQKKRQRTCFLSPIILTTHTSMAPSAAPAAAQSAAASANGTANAAGFAKAQPGSSARAAGANLDVAAMLSEAARTRPPSAIRSLFPAELLPGMLSFLAGKPNPETFPLSAITLTVAPAPGASAPVEVPISGAALAAGMQYGPTNGIRELNEWLVKWQERIHRRACPAVGATARPGAGNWRVTIGQGSQDLLTKVRRRAMAIGLHTLTSFLARRSPPCSTPVTVL